MLKIKKQLIGAVIDQIERAGFRVVAMKKIKLTQETAGEFYLTGFGWRLLVRPKLSPDKNRTTLCPADMQFEMPEVRYISVDQGYFDDNGKFVTVLRRNGGLYGSIRQRKNLLIQCIFLRML